MAGSCRGWGLAVPAGGGVLRFFFCAYGVVASPFGAGG